MSTTKKSKMKKVLLTLGDKLYAKLEKEAKEREVTIPELLRSVILPKRYGDDWMEYTYTTEYQNNSSIAKYLAKNTCQICGKTGVQLDTHHIIPLRLGGNDKLENLMVLCRPCHRQEEKKNKIPRKKGRLLIVDVPADIHHKLKIEAVEKETTVKKLVNDLLVKKLL